MFIVTEDGEVFSVSLVGEDKEVFFVSFVVNDGEMTLLSIGTALSIVLTTEDYSSFCNDANVGTGPTGIVVIGEFCWLYVFKGGKVVDGCDMAVDEDNDVAGEMDE